jgi:alpha-beta hydrolase superfamily lysophospholipase
MAELGVAVYTFDAHGHGRSHPVHPGERCLITRFDDLVGRRVFEVCAFGRRVAASPPRARRGWGLAMQAPRRLRPCLLARAGSQQTEAGAGAGRRPRRPSAAPPPPKVDDTYTFVSVIEQQRRCARLEPCVVGGQSMGALVAAHVALRNQNRWGPCHAGCAAGLGAPWSRQQAPLGACLLAT